MAPLPVCIRLCEYILRETRELLVIESCGEREIDYAVWYYDSTNELT